MFQTDMDEQVLKTNLLAIAVTGLLLLLAGIVLYIFRAQIAGNSRYVMSLPPLGVAAYVFVFNMYRHYDGSLTLRNWDIAREIVYSTVFAALVFGTFTLLMIVIIEVIRR